MAQLTIDTDIAPVCSSCDGYLTDRGNHYFCGWCGSRTPNIGAVEVTNPSHPLFTKTLENNPELLSGYNLLDAEHGYHFGKVVGILPKDDEIVLETRDLDTKIEKRENLSDVIDEIRSDEIHVE